MLRFALRNLLSRPVRSLLSLLGLTVAIVAMVGLFSVAEGLDMMVTKTFGRISGLIAMQPGAPIPLFSRIPASWGDEIAAVEGVSVVNSEIWQRANVIDGKTIFSPPRFLFGTDIETRNRLKHAVYREDIEQGRFLILEDRGTSNALISRQIAEEFHKGIGDTLQVNGYDLTIVGIYHCGSLLLDVAIILDLEQVRAMSRFDPESVSGFYIEQQEGVDDRELIKRIQAVFWNRKVERWSPSFFGSGEGGISKDGSNLLSLINRGLKTLLRGNEERQNTANSEPGSGETKSAPKRIPKHTPETKTAETRQNEMPKQSEQLPIEVRSAMDWAERFEEFSSDLDIFLSIMTGIGVSIAVLSIVNTMLMSVTERVIEFGILKANGWSKLDVLKLITFESATLGLGGGILGASLGWVATQMINSYWPTRVNLFASPGLLLFSVFFSTALGILGGLYPAIWAMRMMPMDAIRRG